MDDNESIARYYERVCITPVIVQSKRKRYQAGVAKQKKAVAAKNEEALPLLREMIEKC